MTNATPTISEERQEVDGGPPPGGERLDRPPFMRDEVVLRGAPTRTAAPVGGTRTVARSSAITTSPGYRLVQTVWLIAAIVETIVALRVLFHAVSANGATAVVRFIDFVSAPLLAPFAGIVNDYRLGNGGMLEISSLITMAVYLVAAFIVARFIRITTAPRTAVPA
jgi:uncharacterized protein YggT (Ycf19 family)